MADDGVVGKRARSLKHCRTERRRAAKLTSLFMELKHVLGLNPDHRRITKSIILEEAIRRLRAHGERPVGDFKGRNRDPHPQFISAPYMERAFVTRVSLGVGVGPDSGGPPESPTGASTTPCEQVFHDMFAQWAPNVSEHASIPGGTSGKEITAENRKSSELDYEHQYRNGRPFDNNSSGTSLEGLLSGTPAKLTSKDSLSYNVHLVATSPIGQCTRDWSRNSSNSSVSTVSLPTKNSVESVR